MNNLKNQIISKIKKHWKASYVMKSKKNDEELLIAKGYDPVNKKAFIKYGVSFGIPKAFFQ